MSWASLTDNQTINLYNLQSGVDAGVFTLKNTIPGGTKLVTKAETEYYVNVNTSYPSFAAKTANELVVKGNLTSSSSTGGYALAGSANDNLYRSVDGGATWSAVSMFSGYGPYIVKVSSTGQYMLIYVQQFSTTAYSVYKSSDYGVNWSLISSLPNANGIKDMAISDNGQYIAIVKGGSSGDVYISSNYGASFTTSGSPGLSNWRGVTMSNSGQYITVVSLNSYIWVSSNYGASFVGKTAYPGSGWLSVVMSKSGQYQFAGSNSIYRSTDYGATWSNTGATGSNGWYSLAISGDGQYGLGIPSTGNEIFKSVNYGANWTFLTAIGNSGSGNWYTCAIAPNGTTQLVGANGNVWPTNSIWRSTNFGSSYSSVSGTDLRWLSVAISN